MSHILQQTQSPPPPKDRKGVCESAAYLFGGPGGTPAYSEAAAAVKLLSYEQCGSNRQFAGVSILLHEKTIWALQFAIWMQKKKKKKDKRHWLTKKAVISVSSCQK